ncbi:hypothetical protein V2J09_020987 [Rumex salicifolius]
MEVMALNYGQIDRSVTDLLKKERDPFKWDATAKLAFDNLKQAMTTAPVLALPNFTQQFTIE